jgi:hypothetical protein
MALNNMSHELSCAAADAPRLTAWLERVGHADLIDIDIQGAESRLLPAMIDALDARAHRLVIATHGAAIHIA